MQCPRKLLGMFLGLVVAASACAQTGSALRWRSGAPLGLQAGSANALVPCGSFAFSCTESASVPLYTSFSAARSLSMQVGYSDDIAVPRAGRTPGLNVSFIGRTGLLPNLGVYGRIGTTFARPGALPALAPTEGGLTYGVGLSWDFSRSASAAVGLDSYDMRGAAGEVRDVRTSLGLRWRY